MARKILTAGLVLLIPAISLAATGKPFTFNYAFNYTFKLDSEPHGFRGIKWQTDIARLDPLATMDCVALIGSYAYYQKKKEDLQYGLAPLADITYEFWNGKFSAVILRVKGIDAYLKLKDYVFARFGSGDRPHDYAQMGVEDFSWNGYFTRMYLKYSDLGRAGELTLVSIGMMNQQQFYDAFVIRERAKEEIKRWQKGISK